MTDPNRTGGLLLALAMAGWIAMIVAWEFAIGPIGSASNEAASPFVERALHYAAKADELRAIWTVEAIGTILLGSAALLLIRRPTSLFGLSSAGWSMVATGSAVYLAMYGIMLGFYWPALDGFATNPALYEAAVGAAMALFCLANIGINFGLVAVFIAEARTGSPVIPRWLAWVTAGISAMGGAMSVMGLLASSGAGGVDSTKYIAVLHFALIGVLGAQIARKPSPADPV